MRRLAALIALLVSANLQAQTLPSGFYDNTVVNGLFSPTAITFAPDGRLLICEKGGTLKSYLNGNVTVELGLSVSSDSERGLLGIALDPQFTNNHYIYLYYTTNQSSLNAPPTPKNRVSRFTESGGVINPSTEKILLDLIPSDAGNHNGGCIRFAPDGKLYIAVGDGGEFHTNAQDLSSLSGKILRINRDGTIPIDNPFYGQAGKRGEIFAYGFRNPFRFNLKPGANTLFIGDVGENTWEEVDVGAAGANYGWPNSEGPDNVSGYTAPIFYYQHTQTESAAIIGGCFLTSTDFPQPFYGDYVYGDYVRSQIGWLTINSLNAVSANGLFTAAVTPVDLYMGARGGLYYPSINAGEVRVITYNPLMVGFAASAASVVGGKNPYLNVQLDNPAAVGGRMIAMQSNNPSVISVPPAFKVPANVTSANFYVTTHPVSTTTMVTLTGNDGRGPQNVNIQVVPPSLAYFAISPASISSGGYGTGTIYLNGIAPSGGIGFTASSDNPTVTLAGSGTVPAGSDHVSIQVNAGLVDSPQVARVTVTSGSVSKSAAVNITPDPSVAGVAPESHTIAAGNQMYVTVALAKKWTSPITVNLSTDNPSALSVPASVTIPAGRIANAVKVIALSVPQNTFVHVYATLGNVVRSNYITITP